MKYGLRYIQIEKIETPEYVSTNRGYECWTNQNLTLFRKTAPFFTTSINDAYSTLEQTRNGDPKYWYVIVEEVPE